MKTATLLTALLLASTSAFAATSWDEAYADYTAIHDALAQDGTKGVTDRAAHLASTLKSLAASFAPAKASVAAADSDRCKKILAKIAKEALALASATDIEASRKAFGGLSLQMMGWRRLVTGDKHILVHCPMAKKYWLQDAGTIANPYMGGKMPTCGVVVKESAARQQAG